jgi:pimeloyl-ACP methyl ester carboxylesterase
MTGTNRLISTCSALFALSIFLWPDGRAIGETAQVNGFEMYYEIIGKGQPLLMLHGFMQVGAEWNPIKDELATGFQLIIPDLRGHGSSTNPSGKFTQRQSALDMFALLDHLKIERIQAIGFSSGGETLLHMATQQPTRIDAMVIIGATPYFTEQARDVMRRQDPENVSEERMQEMRAIHKRGDEQIRALLSHMNGFKDSYDDMNFTPPYLSTITARTLIIQGDRDRFNPVSIALEMYEAIPRSYLWIVPNGGHLPTQGPVQEYFVCTATAFLRDQWRVGSPETPARLCE